MNTNPIRVFFYAALILSLGTISNTLFAFPQAEIRKRETIDLSFQVKKIPEHPFQVTMGCMLTDPDGITMNVSGFYNGDKEWIVRLTPNKTGTWTYTSYGSEKSLVGQNGSIKVDEPSPENHGAIMVGKDTPRYLTYEDGTPYNLLAFEADWLFALDYGNAQLPKTRQLIQAIKQNGFNQVIMNVYTFDVSWKKDPALQPEHEYGGREDMFPFGGSNSKPDHTTLNIAYFKHLDQVIQLLESEGIVAHLMIYVWNKKVNWPQAYSPEDNLYFDYVIKRYQAYTNIFWDISKEALGYGHDDIGYITNRIDRLRKLDAHNRLVTVHDYRYCNTYPEKVDVISIQIWASNLYDRMLEVRKNHPQKPVFNIEHGGYEVCQYDVYLGNYDSPEVCLERNYLIAFAGAYSCYYWQCASWNVIVHNPLSQATDPQPKFSYYRHFNAFWETHPFETLKPVQNASASGYCLTNQKDIYLFYVPKENVSIDIKMKGNPAQKLTTQWFNPLTGEYSAKRQRSWSGYFKQIPAFDGVDNILVINVN